MPGAQTTLWQKCARLISGNLWGTPPSADITGTSSPLSNDQKFAKFEFMLAGVAGQYLSLGDLDGPPQDRGNEAAGKLLKLADAMISDDILKQSTAADGTFIKLQLLTTLPSAKQADFINKLQPTNVQPDEVRKVATEYNEAMESLSTATVDPAYKRLNQAGRNPKNTISYARQLRKLSQDIWDMLLPSSSCCKGFSYHHSAKMELIPSQTLSHSRSFPFHTFLCSRSDQQPSTWHEFELDVNEDISANNRSPPVNLANLRTLCGIVEACNENGQALKIQCAKRESEMCFTIVGLEAYEPTFGTTLPEVSLATLIENGHFKYAHCDGGGSFTLGDKAALLRTLAISLLRFPSQSWFCNQWRAEDVYFLQLASSNLERVKNIDRPYKLTRVTQEPQDRVHRDMPCLGSNPFILSFALLVLEIIRGERISIRKNLGTTVRDTLNEMQGSLEIDFITAIRSCLNFNPQMAGSLGRTVDEKSSDLIYRKIVRPFEDYMDRFGEPIDERELRTNAKQHLRQMPVQRLQEGDFRRHPTRLKKPLARINNLSGAEDVSEMGTVITKRGVHWKEDLEEIHKEASSDSESEGEVNVAILYDDTQKYDDERTKTNAKGFFKTVDKFNDRFIRSLATKTGGRAVRVAILDSGVCATDKLISGAANQIKGRRSWVGRNSDDIDDTCGHGTHVVRAFLKVAPRAHLYIARISEGKEIKEFQLLGIAEAIKHAVNDWDVDVISLSLGLDQPHESIEEEINKALKPKSREQRPRIIFAAAANGGAGIARAWPACKLGVVCINACDGSGSSGGWISPASVSGEDNFTTLGIGVESKWYKDRVHVSGTSFATPIAAAMAACILDFATTTVEMEDAEKAWLYSSNGIRALMRRMSSVVGGYRFLCPWMPTEAQGPLTAAHLESKVRHALTIDYFSMAPPP